MWKGGVEDDPQVRAAGQESYHHLRWRRLGVEKVWGKIRSSFLDTFEMPFGHPDGDVK